MLPIEFQPILKRIRWGGRRLGSVLNKPLGPETDYAESWEIVDHGADQSVVKAGAFQGWTLSRLVAEERDSLLGVRGRECNQFPLLVKFIDASDRLSVQVHPNDEQARHIDPRENGKTEAWVIIDARPDSLLYVGLKPGVDAELLKQACDNERAEECLHAFTPKPGDCIFVPAGTVHAIGAGVLLAEIQQPSNLTLRLFDWGRVGSDGKPRPLHVEQALKCIDFARGPVDPIVPQQIESSTHQTEELVRCPYFVIRRHCGARSFIIEAAEHARVLSFLAGTAEVVSAGDPDHHDVAPGSTLLVPASSPPLRIMPREPVTLLESFCPD